MPNEVKLLPCAHCGAEPDDCPQNSERPHPTRKGEWCVYIWCDNCDARGPEKREPEEAIAAWNTRPTTVVTDEVVERVKRLDEYDPESLPEHLRWKGEGPPPASWYVGGTKVYRSYADYCDD